MALKESIILILIDTFGGIIKNLPWFILFIYGFKLIAKEIKQGVKEMPRWINEVFMEMNKKRLLDRALK